MLKSWMHDIALSVQSKSGVTAGLFVWLGLVVLASLMAFVFLCVAAYDWLALHFGGPIAGLIIAGICVLIALIAWSISVISRRRAKERAILERAARAHSSSWLFDPKILSAAVQAGRALGWQRLVPVALLGFMATQWAREHRRREEETD